ncbi:ABC transporter substrate-binding protein, partial [Acidimicrobiaceae bacterium]|nr:ABC transporter substrate-binding protein [Acidimicrobiaceae bacterium]
MSNNSRLVILFIALIGIAGLSFFIFSEDNVDQQSNIQSDAEIQTTTTISNNSTTSTSTTTTLMETTTTTSTTSTSTTTTTTIPPNQTAIFATQEEINNSKKISYDYLQSGCKTDEPNNT